MKTGETNPHQGLVTFARATSFPTTTRNPTPREHLRRGMAYLHRQEHAQAIAHLTRALSLNPENADAYLQRGNA